MKRRRKRKCLEYCYRAKDACQFPTHARAAESTSGNSFIENFFIGMVLYVILSILLEGLKILAIEF